MSRELRTTLLIMAVALVICSPTIFAAPGPANTNYLAMVFHLVPPTPIPTPIPPDMSTLVVQLSEMRLGYTQSEFHIATNADAAKTYRDPKAAAAAFVAQGRETSWYAEYSSPDYATSDALVVGSQVFRYLTSEGAVQGMAYTVAEAQRDNPDFRPFNLSVPCCPTTALRRTYRQRSLNVDHYLIITQVGRYVTETESIGVLGYFTVNRAVYYAQLGLNHITPVPQRISLTP